MIKLIDSKAKKQLLEKDHICFLLLSLLPYFIIVKLTMIIDY